MFTSGMLVHPSELTQTMTERLIAARPDILGLHPEGGPHADESLDHLIGLMQNDAFVSRLNSLRGAGIKVETECHALSWLVPRKLFSVHPDWFREDRNGSRTPDFNVCVSNSDCLAFVRERSAELARLIPCDTGRYSFWIDDVQDGECHCPSCRSMSASDRALILYRTMLEGIRQVRPEAKLAYLAYFNTLSAPAPAEHDGLFLEFAPIERNTLLPITAGENSGNTEHLPELLRYFGKNDAKVLEYWVDNSLFSHWTKPPVPLRVDFEVVSKDVQYYADLGFEHMTSFACYLSDDYVSLHGVPPLPEFVRAVRFAAQE